MPSLILKPGREKSVLRRHPWIFAGAVQSLEGTASPGETVELLSSERQFLGRAAFSPQSQIRARIWTFEDEPVDAGFLRTRIESALRLRRALGLDSQLDAYRLVHAESDGLPGLIVDRYCGQLVVQCLTAGSEYWRETLADLLLEATGLEHIFERSDQDVRALEGLSARVGVLRGNPSTSLVIRENELQFEVDLERGHKTGFYLDQRLNRRRLREYARGRQVLDCFCYSGGFTLNAFAGGALSVLSVDSSVEALDLLRRNAALNQMAAQALEILQGDVFQILRKFRDEGRSFDMIVLDPPKFAPTTAQLQRAARGYKDINLLAFKLLRPGGILFTFSCSGGVDALLFQKIVASAALDAQVNVRILEVLSQAGDHPVALNFPESAYLKGLICLRD